MVMYKALYEAFERHYAPMMDDTGCWIWFGARSERGYGKMGTNRGPTVRAHRVSYEKYIGPIPEDKNVLHKCDVRDCVNPKHLFLGTNKDNTQDMLAKGRGRNKMGGYNGL
jgi:hypothetical protein